MTLEELTLRQFSYSKRRLDDFKTAALNGGRLKLSNDSEAKRRGATRRDDVSGGTAQSVGRSRVRALIHSLLH